MIQAMNIKFSYLYRDYANYKNYGEIIFSNPNALGPREIEATIKGHLIDSHWFYSTEWKVPDLHFENWDPEDDHFLHEFHSVEESTESPNSELSVDDFLSQVRSARNKYV